ncbi:MAG TPA: addiction module antidote protein [Caulobacteraceae bacterium]|nr:addiction module antidote protein [Caulobacteraceae bacterium]
MALATTPFDPATHLTDGEAIEEFLRSAFEDGTPAEIAAALGVVARAHGMSELARDTGLNRQALYKALRPDGNAGFATILKVAQALGFRLVPERTPA